MGIAKQLYQLQEVDLELESGEQALARIMGQLGESQAVVAARNEVAREKQRLEELGRQQHSAEWEVDDLTTKLTVLEEKLYSGRIKNPKELASLQQEADGFKSRRNRAEDKALEIMEQVSVGETKIATLGSELGRLEREWERDQQQLLAEAERYKETIAELKQRRQLLIAETDPSVVSVYQEVKRQKSRAVAKVERGTCRGCGISLSTARLQQAKGDNLVRCNNCGRILFFA
jgi:predicted  nucleic acid-binding Zn-ribbon protein